MNDLEQTLAGLTEPMPAGLEQTTIVEAGAGDLVATTDSRFGPLWIAWSTSGITGLTPRFAAKTFDAFIERHRRVGYEIGQLPRLLEEDLQMALSGGTAEGLDIDLRGVAPFQKRVLQTCATIPVGAVRSYGWIANEMNNRGATRAVGTALGRNPVPLLVPCHRVVRSDGSIGNYAFGAEMKRDLLVEEGAIAL